MISFKILVHMVIDLKEVRVSSSNLVPCLSTKNHLLTLLKLVDWALLSHFSSICPGINVAVVVNLCCVLTLY